MKTIQKTGFSLLLVMLLLILFIPPVFASDASVTFRGLSEGFEFSSGSENIGSNLFHQFQGVMPGDKLTERVVVKNEATDCDYIKLYIRAETHDETENPLSPEVSAAGETVATMSEFLSQLHMKVYHGDDLIYEASPDELDGLSDKVPLGSFRSGEDTILTVELDVPAELGNQYANRIGEVDWIFSVEGFDDPTPPAPDHRTLTVHKVWEDQNAADRPASVVAQLLRDGTVYDSVTLSDANHWTYTWDGLEEDHHWEVAEKDVPKGYKVTYSVSGNQVMIINSKEGPEKPSDPIDLTAKKVWAGDKDQLKDRPDSVSVTLHNGTTPIETVKLGAWNQWSYTWQKLDGGGNWSVIESNVPKGYTPSYSTSGSVVTITNTASLIAAGQLNWPIPVLGGIGLLILVVGVTMMRSKRKDRHA